MILHYLKIALRNLLKYRTQFAISVLGLAVGLAFFTFGFHWLKYETSYDSFYPDADRSYLVYTQDENNKQGHSLHALASFIRECLPEVEVVTQSVNTYTDYTFDDKRIKTPDFMSVDSCFLEIFPQVLVCGRPLEQANEIIISESFAKKHFSSAEKALDVVLYQASPDGFQLVDAQQLRIVGVMTDAPKNATMTSCGYYRLHEEQKIDINNPKNWEYQYVFTHLKLKDGIREEDFKAHLD